MIFKIQTLLLFAAIAKSDAFTISSPLHRTAEASISALHMTPPTRPGQKADTTPFDSAEYFKSRGMNIDPKANENKLDVSTNVSISFFVFYVSYVLKSQITILILSMLNNHLSQFSTISHNIIITHQKVFKTTDVGDFFPENYVDELESVIPRCSQNVVVQQSQKNLDITNLSPGQGNTDPAMPGMDYTTDEYWEQDPVNHFVGAGIEECNPYTEQCIPEGMEFIPGSVVDGVIEMNVSRVSASEPFVLEIKPFCMGFEDYFAAFTSDSHPSLSVSPNSGRMDSKRGGQSTFLEVMCDPRGGDLSGTWEGMLVVNIPEDGSKLTYKVIANVG